MADGYEVLTAQHREVERLFETYLHDNEDSIAREICQRLTEHTQIEEAVLYPALRRNVDGGDDLADEAEQDHAAVKTLISRVYDAPPANMVNLISALRQEVEEHIEREESELFPSMRDSGVEGEALGAKITDRREVDRATP